MECEMLFTGKVSAYRKVLLLMAALLIASLAPAAPGQQETIDRISRLLIDNYVDETAARRISESLQTASEEGDFDAYREPDELAAALALFLQPYDRHFSVWYSEMAGPLSLADTPDEVLVDLPRRQNFGFRHLEILPGNVAYLDLRSFDSTATAGDTAVATMQFLSKADAIIFDLRQNGGGEPEMVQLLCSYFFAAEPPVLLNSLYWRKGNVTQEFWTLPSLQGERMPDTPLFILISARTGSAAEEFAYNMQTRGRATLIGETTAGVANPGGVFEIGDGYSMFISTGKAINPVTGDNWEAKGVVPDRVFDALGADKFAYDEALRLIAQSYDGEVPRDLAWAQEAARVRLSPVIITDAEQLAILGRFGDRRIEIQSGELVFLRGRRPARALIPLGDDAYFLQGVEDRQLSFTRNATGQVDSLVETYIDGTSQVFAKDD
jgi:hypothetical protein